MTGESRLTSMVIEAANTFMQPSRCVEDMILWSALRMCHRINPPLWARIKTSVFCGSSSRPICSNRLPIWLTSCTRVSVIHNLVSVTEGSLTSEHTSSSQSGPLFWWNSSKGNEWMKLGWMGLAHLEADCDGDHFDGAGPQERPIMMNDGMEGNEGDVERTGWVEASWKEKEPTSSY